MESKLITANTWFAGYTRRGNVAAITWETYRLGILKRLFIRFRIPEAGYCETTRPVPAIVNHGAWIVLCPDCKGAEYAWEEGWFFCCSCKNAKTGHKYRRLSFPPNRREIEGLLAVRPLDNRNWKLGETIEELKAENLLHAAELLTAERG